MLKNKLISKLEEKPTCNKWHQWVWGFWLQQRNKAAC